MQKFIEYAVNILFEEYTEGNPKILNFLKIRKLQFKDIERYGIGYIRPNNPTPKFVLDNAEYYKQINLLSNDNRLNIQDRIIVPVKDIYGVFKMISCRDAKEYENKPSNNASLAFQKYLTIIDKEIIKSEILHGYSDNLPYIRSANKILLTEGQFDHIALDVLGCRYSVAISGSKIHEYFIELINKISKSVKIVLALDNDTAGRTSILDFIISHPELIDRLAFIDYDVPKDIAKDPDEYTSKFGLERFLSLEKDAIELFRDRKKSVKSIFVIMLDLVDIYTDNLFLKSKSDVDDYISGKIQDYNKIKRQQNAMQCCLNFWSYKKEFRFNRKTDVFSEINNNLSDLLFYIGNKAVFNNELLCAYSVLTRDSINSDIFDKYYFLQRINSDIAVRFYISLLQKNLKTFENVGNFCYNAYYHKKRIHWFIERFCALWFIIRYKQRFGRYDRFDYNNRLLELSFYHNNIESVTECEQLKQIGEIYDEPIYSDGELVSMKISKNYTEKLLKKASDIYLKLKIKWIEQDGKTKES